MTVSVDVQVDGVLADHVLAVTGEFGQYPDPAEYVRNLIRRDINEVELRLSDARIAELREAFATPEEEYVTVTLEEVLARNGLSRAARAVSVSNPAPIDASMRSQISPAADGATSRP